MALLWIDGFDHYINTTNGSAGAWSQIYGSSSIGDKSLTTGRCGGQSLNVYSTGGIENVYRVVGPMGPTFTHGCALYIGSVGSACGLLEYYQWSPTVAILSVKLNADGTISILRGNRNGTVLGNSTSSITTAGWYYFELTASIDGSTGSAVLDVDGSNWITIASANTSGSGANSITTIEYCETGVFSMYVDDTYFRDDTTRMGVCRVATFSPYANVANNQWISSSGNDTSAISETVYNNDTNYIYAPNVDNVSIFTASFSLSTLPNTNVKAVVVNVLGKKSDSGDANLQTTVLSDTVYQNSSNITLTTTYTPGQGVYEIDPNNSAPWTLANTANVKIGVKRP